METIKGSIKKIMFTSEDTGYKVISIKTPSGSPSVVTGEFGPEIIVGSQADFHGEFKTHPKYGMQFRAYGYHVTYNAEELSSVKLFLDTIAINIGPERSQAIIDHFGKDTIDILSNSPERLVEVEGIGRVSAQSLKESWNEHKDTWKDMRQEYSLRAFLYSLGIKERRVKKILSMFGGGMSAEEKIRGNPYILCDVEGFGFSTADYVAKKLGVPESDPNRLTAFILYLLNNISPSNGHLYLPKNAVPIASNQYSVESGTHFLGKDHISLEDVEESLNNLLNEEKIIIEEEKVYSKGTHFFESQSASLLSQIMKKKSDLIFLNKETVNKHIDTFEKENGIKLSPEQKDALYFFSEKKVFVITGAPGTGKTTILKALVELAKRMKLHLTCMTPTGISAKKMAITVEHDAYTIHRRLGFRGNEWMANENNPYDTDIAIIDESSMIDQEVFYRLLAAMNKRTHLVFVGDQDQLPSVGAGNVLKELVACEEIPVVRLETIFRQDEASDIIKVAHRIKRGDTDLSLFKPEPSSDVFFYRHQDYTEVENIIVAMATRFKKERRLFQILTPRNNGPLGVEPLNKLLQEVLNPPDPTLNEINCGSFILRRGDRIIVKKNDYENVIFNGDIGKVTSINSGQIVIDIDGRPIDLGVDEIHDKIRLAYAITVHKSQGMEYPYVILPFINQFGKNMLQRNLLYTAITRAKKKVIVLGHGSALEKAINNGSVTKRNTILGERIQKCLRRDKNDFSLKQHTVLELTSKLKAEEPAQETPKPTPKKRKKRKPKEPSSSQKKGTLSLMDVIKDLETV